MQMIAPPEEQKCNRNIRPLPVIMKVQFIIQKDNYNEENKY